MYYRVLVATRQFYGSDGLTYSFDKKLKAGQIVSIELRNKNVLGIIDSTIQKPSYTTKKIVSVWDMVLPNNSLLLFEWMRNYYPAPLGVIAELFTPPKLTRSLKQFDNSKLYTQSSTGPSLTDDQRNVLDIIRKSKTNSFMLHGETGTGKTRIYIELAKQALESNKSAIILTPEIGLTQSILDEFRSIFGSSVVVMHSKLSTLDKRNNWLRVHGSISPVIVIGPRSALFLPIQNIGLIIVDEFHDTSYKHGVSPNYQTTRVAGKLANLSNAKFILGSATPLISDYYMFQQKKLPILKIDKPAIKSKFKVVNEVVDMKNRSLFSKSSWMSNNLLYAIDEALSLKEQSMIFLNRRGSARLILCNHCGWQATCKNCDVSLVYHQDHHNIRCHNCGYNSIPPNVCPECRMTDLIYKSVGTKTIEQEIKKLFPHANICRIDGDTESHEQIQNILPKLISGEIDIIIGTQSVVKGFDLPKLSVVGVINADSGVQIPDYTATEKNYQLINQVSGRIGRGHRDGRLVIQTHDPNNLTIQTAINKNFGKFLETELNQRELYGFPPYYYIVKIICTRSTSKSAEKTCINLLNNLKDLYKNVLFVGPTPRFVEKSNGKFSWQIIAKSKNRNKLTEIVQNLPNNIRYDLDPSDLL